STWVLSLAWLAFQKAHLFHIDPAMERAGEQFAAFLEGVNPLVVVLVMAILPAFCEEFLFRGFALSGLTRSLGRFGAVLLVAAAFAIYHQSIHRLAVTAGLGVVLGLIVMRWGSIWPAMMAHMMHNALLIGLTRSKTLAQFVEERLHFNPNAEGMPPM